MGKLIELGVHRAKRNGEYVSNEEARMIRGFIGWKLENKRAMDARDDADRQTITAALRAAGGKMNVAAAALKIPYRELRSKIRRLGLDR